MAKRVTTADFIRRARKVHGNRYDYSKVEYVKSSEKVAIICPEHGRFWQTPNAHFVGKGCKSCADKIRGLKRRLTTDEFIRNVKAVHGERYDYSKVVYVSAKSKVTIICPVHGEFEQRALNHYIGRGCHECGGNKPLTLDRLIERANKIHKGRYDYSRVEYQNVDTKVEIICPDHGSFFQRPAAHLRGFGCDRCGQIETGKSLAHSLDRFLEDARQSHGDRYDYSQVEYVNALSKVTIICPKHGAFQQTPASHIRDIGCPACAESGFDPSEPGLLYYIAVATDDGDTRYKIGITNNTVAGRFPPADLARIRIVKTWQFSVGRVAAEREAEILYQYAGDRYYGPEILIGAGNTEIFTHDILGLDRRDDEFGQPVVDADANLISRPIQRDFDL